MGISRQLYGRERKGTEPIGLGLRTNFTNNSMRLLLSNLRLFKKLDNIQTDSITLSDSHQARYATDFIKSNWLLGISPRGGGGSCGVSDLEDQSVGSGWRRHEVRTLT